MRRLVAFLLMAAGLWANNAAAADKAGWPRWRAVWRVSQVLLAGANAADAASSWGKAEANPLVRTGSSFGYGSLAIKMGALAGGLTMQHFAMHKDAKQARLMATANVAVSGVLAGVAVHNFRVPRGQ